MNALINGMIHLRIIATGLFVLVYAYTFAQTGPGGVSSGATNLLLWLDGKDVNADGTNPTIGSAVTTWYDKSGNGVNVTENTTGVATYSANGVTFNNIGYLNGSDATFPTGNSPRTVIVCASSPSTTTDDVFFFYGTSNNNQSYGILKRGSGTATPNGVRNYFYNNDYDVAAGWTPSGTIRIVTATYTPNTQAVYLHNNAGTTNTPGTVNTTLSAQGLQIGGWSSFDLQSQATIAEVIFYDKVLNTAERIIVNNYLAAKYGLTLSANDLYDNDNGGNGNYDYDVAGIGRAANAAQTNEDAWSSITRITNPTDLNDNNEYYIWGHDNGALTATTAGIPSGVVERLTRIWRGSETGGDGNVGNIDLSFDMTGFGPFAASDLRLLVSANNDTDFSDAGDVIVSGAVNTSGNIYTFSNVSALTNDRRFTIGIVNTPLPIDLLSFNAKVRDDNVMLTWSTSSETNNNHFTIERTKDGLVFEVVDKVPGAGNSQERKDYELIDSNPFQGKSYYRLSQTDYDGTTKYFPMVSVDVAPSQFDFKLYPNPTHGEFDIELEYASDGVATGLSVSDLQGREIFSFPSLSTNDKVKTTFHIIPPVGLLPGVYVVKLTHGQRLFVRRLVVE